jgi:hypothetical protein
MSPIGPYWDEPNFLWRPMKWIGVHPGNRVPVQGKGRTFQGDKRNPNEQPFYHSDQKRQLLIDKAHFMYRILDFGAEIQDSVSMFDSGEAIETAISNPVFARHGNFS